jgi:NitT/TauT family transport system substrate-binding protein
MNNVLRMLCVVFLSSAVGQASADDKVVLGLDWLVLGRHAGFFVAKQNGYYQKEGIDVQIERGYGAADAVKRLAAGQTHFAFGDAGSVVLARAQGIEAKAVAMVYARAPFVLWTRADANIKKPKDLEGKSIGSPAGASVRVLFPAFAKLTGVDGEKINWVTVDVTGLYPLLFSGKVNAIVDFELGWPTISKKAAEAGVKLEPFRFADYGFEMYSNAILATDAMIKDKPDLVRRFVKASLEGYKEAFNNPEAAGAILAKSFPQLDPGSAAEEVVIVRSLAASPEAKAQGLGYISPEKMTRTRDIVAETYNVQKVIPVENLYTNRFLSK